MSEASIELDFNLLPQILRHQLFRGLQTSVEEPLAQLRIPETLDRLRGSSRFLGEVTASNPIWLNRAYLRAGLSEFRSVKEALSWDLRSRSVHSPGKSKNPLVHLMFRLRRIAVYVDNAPINESCVTAKIEFQGTKHSSDIKILLFEDIEKYLRKEKLDRYLDEDIARICMWFEKNQSIYGASQVLDAGVFAYCHELLDVYRDRK